MLWTKRRGDLATTSHVRTAAQLLGCPLANELHLRGAFFDEIPSESLIEWLRCVAASRRPTLKLTTASCPANRKSSSSQLPPLGPAGTSTSPRKARPSLGSPTWPLLVARPDLDLATHLYRLRQLPHRLPDQLLVPRRAAPRPLLSPPDSPLTVARDPCS